MFNLGLPEMMVLAIVGLVVLGPDRLPGLARDAANLLRTLRELATGARQQLRDELGPEFADVDLRNLNPKTAVRNAVFGDDFDFNRLNPRTALRDAVLGDDDLRAADPRASLRETHDEIRGRNGSGPVSMAKQPPSTRSAPPRASAPATPTAPPPAAGPASAPPAAERPRPRPRPGPGPAARPASPYDSDAT